MTMKVDHQKLEHTGSYYAASVNERTDYPVLQGAKSADVCVVGAGFTGVSAALALAATPLRSSKRIAWAGAHREGTAARSSTV